MSEGQSFKRGYKAGSAKGPVEYKNPFSEGYLHNEYQRGFQKGRADRAKLDSKALNAKRRNLI